MIDESGHRASRKAVEIKGVSKVFGTYQALKPVSFDIYDNEFFTLLGPSGCGKTTLLRMIAGFEQPTAGQIFLHGSDIQGLPPHKRRVNTVFQSYALFPHMSVEQNIGFGLENLGWSKARRDARVADMLRLVHMEAFARRPASARSARPCAGTRTGSPAARRTTLGTRPEATPGHA